jgi:hypothetical protein
MRQFEVVCKTGLKLRTGAGRTNIKKGHFGSSLVRIAAEDFSLTSYQCQLCLGRARNFLERVYELDRARNLLIKQRGNII